MLRATLFGIFFLVILQANVRAFAGDSKDSKPDTQSKSTLEQTTYLGMLAYRLSDGRSEAVVVPAIGRIMHYGLIGGNNLLWNSAPAHPLRGEWFNWGGDKSWPAPQSQWPLSIKYKWPPSPAWDGEPHRPTVLAAARLKLTSGFWPRIECRVIREFHFDSEGDFVIRQTFEKMGGAPVELAIWNITQIKTPQAIFVLTNPQSTYKGNFHWMLRPKEDTKVAPDIQSIQPDLLRLKPNGSNFYKIGIDAPAASIVAVIDGLAFRQSAPLPSGRYPDGAEGNGFPIEIFNSDATGEDHYVETELLSPLRVFYAKSKWTHTVKWRLQAIEYDSADPNSIASIKSFLRNDEP